VNSLVLATHNHDKVRELRALLEGSGVLIRSLDDFPQIGVIPEEGETFQENALIKARSVFRATGLPSLADDSGLEVHYLNGEPGVHSSRYSGPGSTTSSNCRKLLQNLRGVPPRRRTARFRCVIALVTSGVEHVVEGTVRGTIAEWPRGNRGFGYDPIFIPLGSGLTFAEMDPPAKDQISHRSEAIKAIRPVLHSFFGLSGA